VEAKKRNQQTKVFVRQVLKDDKAGKLDSFKDILSVKKKKKGAEEGGGGLEEDEEEDGPGRWSSKCRPHRSRSRGSLIR
jgi:hypothetical protein